ncbi:hypothetical protein PARPLA_00647 [Rhodobacteraceae bacterium THAF1]|nr:hypothetical protein FIU81_14025 [Palleronia sp. THAF1]VDC17307.1 hypothetical protein PARPLA_00647 [Rhodobacteraceae bacterium THAF1]
MWIVFAAGVTRTNLAPLLILMLPVAVFGPVALIWGLYRQAQATAALARDHAALRREMAKLSDAAKTSAQRPAVAQPAPPSHGQSALKLAEPSADMPAPVSTADLVLALNFPADAEDKDGFRALKRALTDPAMKPIVTAAQDVLTLLSHDGLYMDDLAPERARPETWRRFARGERGAAVRDIGGIRVPEAVATVSDRLRSDPIFRDTALHFLRIFDQLVTRVEPRMTDTELSRLGDTRSARAFMLVGRAIGTFD